jgi:hypothetical protein
MNINNKYDENSNINYLSYNNASQFFQYNFSAMNHQNYNSTLNNFENFNEKTGKNFHAKNLNDYNHSNKAYDNTDNHYNESSNYYSNCYFSEKNEIGNSSNFYSNDKNQNYYKSNYSNEPNQNYEKSIYGNQTNLNFDKKSAERIQVEPSNIPNRNWSGNYYNNNYKKDHHNKYYKNPNRQFNSQNRFNTNNHYNKDFINKDKYKFNDHFKNFDKKFNNDFDSNFKNGNENFDFLYTSAESICKELERIKDEITETNKDFFEQLSQEKKLEEIKFKEYLSNNYQNLLQLNSLNKGLSQGIQKQLCPKYFIIKSFNEEDFHKVKYKK